MSCSFTFLDVKSELIEIISYEVGYFIKGSRGALELSWIIISILSSFCSNLCNHISWLGKKYITNEGSYLLPLSKSLTFWNADNYEESAWRSCRKRRDLKTWRSDMLVTVGSSKKYHKELLPCYKTWILAILNSHVKAHCGGYSPYNIHKCHTRCHVLGAFNIQGYKYCMCRCSNSTSLTW